MTYTSLPSSTKGQLTKTVKTANLSDRKSLFSSVKKIFSKIYPPEQAKHATRQFLATI